MDKHTEWNAGLLLKIAGNFANIPDARFFGAQFYMESGLAALDFKRSGDSDRVKVTMRKLGKGAMARADAKSDKSLTQMFEVVRNDPDVNALFDYMKQYDFEWTDDAVRERVAELAAHNSDITAFLDNTSEYQKVVNGSRASMSVTAREIGPSAGIS